jgi:MFS family permease
MVFKMKVTKRNSSSGEFSFLPIYILEFLRTTGSGLVATSAANHLIIELQYSPIISSIVSAAYFLGFLSFTFFFGHLSDRFGQHRVIRVLGVVSLILSFIYLIPIKSNFTLGIFFVARVIDGGSNGIFWPTVQKYSTYAGDVGDRQKQQFLSAYNFSFNIGFLFGMLAGAGLVKVSGSNYQNFFWSVLISIIQLVIAYMWLRPKRILGQSLTSRSAADPAIPSDSGVDSKKTFPLLPISFILTLLLTHSLFEGAILIYFPLKVEMLMYGSFWVFIIGFSKALSQTIASSIIAFFKPKSVSVSLGIGIMGIISSWLAIIWAQNVWLIILFIVFSGGFQGLVYVMCMGLMTTQSEYQKSAKPFSFFQAIMGSGRMLGQVIIGMTASISLNTGLWGLLIYDSVILISVLIYILKEKRSPPI